MELQKYIVFLRGINVGGHHKLPMAELRRELEKLGFKNVVTLLNSGNIVLDALSTDPKQLEETIAAHLEKVFGFPVPTIVRTAVMISRLLKDDPFAGISMTKDIRLYVSFLQREVDTDLSFPWTSDDKAFQMLSKSDQTIVSVLDLSITKTPKGMEALEKHFGSEITTRNWNTIKRIGEKL